MNNCRAAVAALVLAQFQPALAQQAPIVAQPVMAQAQPQFILPKNTELVLRLNDDLSTKRARVGDMFYMSLVQDLIVNNYVIIPKGARAGGEITWRTGKGAFGKSGKMEVQLRYIEVGGRRLPIEGGYRQEGEGNTVATVGAVVLVGVFGGFVTGKSGLIPRGRELVAHTSEDLPVAMAAPQPYYQQPAAPQVSVASAGVPVAIAALPYQPAALRPGNGVALIPAQTPSGYCIEAPAGYVGSGARSSPAITSAMPRCRR